MKIFLETARLTLREFEPTDVDNLVDLDSDPEVMRYLSGGKPTSREDAEKALERLLALHSCYDSFGVWATHERDSGRFIGWFLFRPAYDNTLGIEIGYRLKREAWGKGYATEGSRALLELGFTKLGLRRVFAMAMKANAASRHVLEKIGMRLQQELEETGDMTPGRFGARYGITRDEWRARNASAPRG